MAIMNEKKLLDCSCQAYSVVCIYKEYINIEENKVNTGHVKPMNRCIHLCEKKDSPTTIHLGHFMQNTNLRKL